MRRVDCIVWCVYTSALFWSASGTRNESWSSSEQFPITKGETLLTDVTSRRGLGDGSGTVIAVGDFNGDRYTDLLTLTSQTHRSVQVLLWNHSNQKFQAPLPRGEEQDNLFDLGAVQNLISEATVGSATTFDADSDGHLDVLLSVRLMDDKFAGVLLRGSGDGFLSHSQTLPGVTPGMLILDVNEDMAPDIFFITPMRERTFLLNNGTGSFHSTTWKPLSDGYLCLPTFPFNSNAFVDVSGDCLPDLVVSTSCGLEVWHNHGLEEKPISKWFGRHEIRKGPIDFTTLSLPKDRDKFKLLGSSVWNPQTDGRANFADFNGDGLVDVGVVNALTGELRISYGIVGDNADSGPRGRVCSSGSDYGFETFPALRNIKVSDTQLGYLRQQATFWVGDFNYDGRADVLLVDGDTGTLSIYKALSSSDESNWLSNMSTVARIIDGLLFSFTGIRRKGTSQAIDVLAYQNKDEIVLRDVEDPLGAAFFDVDESGRQDILIPQNHGTRLLQNNFREQRDSLFFKVAAGSSAVVRESSAGAAVQKALPIPGITIKLWYGGRHRKETHICTQCPQTGFLSLQSCSCHFGITRIANYIEKVAVGAVYGVRTWKNLMPNAIAMVSLKRQPSSGVPRWKIAYLSKGRDGQVKKVLRVLFATLIVLVFAILYARGLEVLEEPSNRTIISCT